jgi:hydroxymethylglutaryl-CoA lyase
MQMANSSEILQKILEQPPMSKGSKAVTYQFLVPNVKGLENFLSTYESYTETSSSSRSESSTSTENNAISNTSSPDAKATRSDGSDVAQTITSSSFPRVELSLFTAATESFARKNTNCSVAESIERFKPVFARAKANGLPVRAYISVALGCPYEGPDVDPHQVASLAVSLLELGAYEISVADTTGMGTAPKTTLLLKTLKAAGINNDDLALHFHDTYGQALVNSVVALEHGIRTFDAAVGGLGGCPFSPGATGNVATEDLVHCFHSLGAETGVDIEKLSEIGSWISGELGRNNESRAGKATMARLKNTSS